MDVQSNVAQAYNFHLSLIYIPFVPV